MNPISPITEAELHAYVDAQLTPEREREIEAWLEGRPDEAQRIDSYRAQKRALHALFDPVLDETLPARMLRAAQPRLPWYPQRWAAGFMIAVLSGAAGWGLHGGADRWVPAESLTQQGRDPALVQASAGGFAQRAAVAHAVYVPEQRRPVEVDAAHEDQLVAWLSKRMGAPMRPPRLQGLGYALEGGRLLPGGQGPVAQFMYRDEAGSRLTLYVSDEGSGGDGKTPADTGFRFSREGTVNVFYWVEGRFGYAISADADRGALERVSGEVYRQLNAATTPR